MTRGCIFVDYSYFCKITLNSLKSADWVIKNVKQWSPKSGRLKDVDEWQVYVYDAQYEEKHAKLLKPGKMHKMKQEFYEMEANGIVCRFGEYALRFKSGGKMVGFGEKGDPYFMQKGVDTLIVLDAIDEVQQGTDVFCFITGDRDFVPLFRKLGRLNKLVMVYYSSLAGENESVKNSAGHARDLSKEHWITSTLRQE